MSKNVLPTLLSLLLGGCSAIVNPSGTPFAEDGGAPPSDTGAGDSTVPPTDGGPDTSTGDTGAGDTGTSDTGTTDTGTTDSGGGCVGGCDDGISCTVDSCVAGVCQHELSDALCDDGISCTVDRCDAVDDCINTPNDGLCDDGFCFTGGRCDVGRGGCVGGDRARDCRDGDPCTSDTCDPVAMMCVNDPRDDDGDGFPVDRIFFGGGGSSDCGGTDCDDRDPDVHPGATELCDGLDNNCDGTIDEGCPTPPDDCGSAQEIPLTAGSGSVSGSFGVLNNDYGTACGNRGGRDAVYYVDVTSLSDITIDTLGSDSDTVLAVTTDCGTLRDFAANACDDDIDRGSITDSRIWLHRVGPAIGASSARVFILVDGFDGSATGAYNVNVRVVGAHADTCGGPLDITGGGTLAGTIGVTSARGARGSCQDAASLADAEAVATFTGSSSGSATFTAFSRDFTPDVYVRSTCGSMDSEVGCATGSSVGGGFNRAELMVDVTPSNHYTLFVDGATAGGGYSVDYQP